MPPMFMGANQMMMRDLHIAANPFRHELDTLRDPFNIYPKYSTYQKGHDDIMNEPLRYESSVMTGRERDRTIPDTSYTPFSWNKPKPVEDSNSYTLGYIEDSRRRREARKEEERIEWMQNTYKVNIRGI